MVVRRGAQLVHWQRSEFDVALGYYEQALEIRRSTGDRRNEAEVRHHLAIALWHLGRYAEAAEGMRTALLLYEETGNRQGRLMMLNNLGDLDLQLGRHTSALRHYDMWSAPIADHTWDLVRNYLVR